ncbi:MAG: hypothetical protein ACI9BK_001405 [Acidimicrobiales bacterium]|jgi:hypothetical protein
MGLDAAPGLAALIATAAFGLNNHGAAHVVVAIRETESMRKASTGGASGAAVVVIFTPGAGRSSIAVAAARCWCCRVAAAGRPSLGNRR